MLNYIDNPIYFKIDNVSFWCEDVVNSFKEVALDNDKDREFVECCKDLLEECIYLNESVFLKDKTIRIRKVKFDDNNGSEVWIGEWEEMLDRMRDGMVGYYRFGESGQRVLEEMSCKVTPFACKVKMEKEERR